MNVLLSLPGALYGRLPKIARDRQRYPDVPAVMNRALDRTVGGWVADGAPMDGADGGSVLTSTDVSLPEESGEGDRPPAGACEKDERPLQLGPTYQSACGHRE
ncbi:hypothetical protein BGZ54_009251 [Gamsiella multidivaricata]|nr:hypothetical protein BGZ54_009251 [Gamsiella multidivaricata]